MTQIKTGGLLTIKELFRNRIVLILLFVIPSIFYAITLMTTTKRIVAFKLASLSEKHFVQVSMRSEALIFIGLAAVGLLSSFLALNLIQKSSLVNKRLVLCGYKSSEIVVSKFLVLLLIIILVGGYMAAVLPLFFNPNHFFQMTIGFVLIGFVYGSYGLLIGSIVKRELEGILFIVLLSNIDVGWLQNPIFYTEAQNKVIIRWLPAFYPSQVSMVSAFTDYSIFRSVIWSVGYGIVFLSVALFIFWKKMKRHSSITKNSHQNE